MRARYPDQVGGDNLESRFGYIELSPRLGQLYPIWDNVVCHAMAGVWRTRGYPRRDVG